MNKTFILFSNQFLSFSLLMIGTEMADMAFYLYGLITQGRSTLTASTPISTTLEITINLRR